MIRWRCVVGATGVSHADVAAATTAAAVERGVRRIVANDDDLIPLVGREELEIRAREDASSAILGLDHAPVVLVL